MNISLENAISLHKCIMQIEEDEEQNGSERIAFDEDVIVRYVIDKDWTFIILEVTISKINSEKAKYILQSYFNE